jgi:[ribosomal protein S5]-alanine N-acetyltransferase
MAHRPIITGSQFKLRPFREGDEPALVRHADNRNVWRNLADLFPHPYTFEAAEAWVRLNIDTPIDHLSLAIAVDDEVVGAIGLTAKDDVHRKTAEIGYWLSEAYWGRGIASEAVGLIVEYGFQALDLARIEAAVFPWNPASARVLEKNGFAFEARLKHRVFKDGELVDELMYARFP